MNEAMRAAFEAVNKTLDYTRKKDAWGRDKYKHSHIQIAWEYWQAATLAELERFAAMWETHAAQAAIDYANGHPVNFTAGAERIRKGETL